MTIDEPELIGRDGRIRVRDYHPEHRSARTALLWVHGGGFAFGGLDMKESDAPARALAAAGTFVRTIDYRLAPRVGFVRPVNLAAHAGRFPAGLHDVIDAALALASLEQRPISIGGASAGANLAAAATLSLRDAHSTMPRSLALAYGAFHLPVPTNPSVEDALRGPLARWNFNPKIVHKIALNYVGDANLLRPGYAFPGGMDLSGLPPTLVLDASNDRLRASGHAFADELRGADIEVHESVVTGMHGFLGATRSRSFSDGMRQLGAWLSDHD